METYYDFFLWIKRVQWQNERSALIREGRWGNSAARTNKNKVADRIWSCDDNPDNLSAQKRGALSVTELGDWAFILALLLLMPLHQSSPPFSLTPSLAASSLPSILPTLPDKPLITNNSAIHCVKNQDHELISRTSQSHHQTCCFCHSSLFGLSLPHTLHVYSLCSFSDQKSFQIS